MTDPPLGACPSWCELPAGHDWEDNWRDGLIRYHSMRIKVESHPCGPDHAHDHEIGVDEIEQWVIADNVRARQRQIVLDLEAPTNLTVSEAIDYIAALAKSAALAAEGLTEEHQRDVH